MTNEKQVFHNANGPNNEFFLFACKVSIARMKEMIVRLSTLPATLLLLAGCPDDSGPEVVDPIVPKKPNSKPFTEDRAVRVEAPRFASNDRKLGEIMEDFSGSIDAYPLVDQAETIMKKNGRLYRRGIEDEPFTGTVVESFPNGSLSLSTTFYEGKPHGSQTRNFPSGAMASEIFFDKGVLSGTKTKWWKNGRMREEEYWSDGKFRGRRLWDEIGRLIREEIVPED